MAKTKVDSPSTSSESGVEKGPGEGTSAKILSVVKGEVILPKSALAESLNSKEQESGLGTNSKGLANNGLSKFRFILPKPESPLLDIPSLATMHSTSPEEEGTSSSESLQKTSLGTPQPPALHTNKSLSIFLTSQQLPKPDAVKESPSKPETALFKSKPATANPLTKAHIQSQKQTKENLQGDFAKTTTKRKATDDPQEECKSCPKCGSEFKDKTLLSIHTSDYHKVDSFACKNCKKGFICDRWTYQDHIKKCRLGEAEFFSCPVCQKKFISKENCVIHQREQKHQTPEDDAQNFASSVQRGEAVEMENGQMRKRRKTVSPSSVGAIEEDVDDPDEMIDDDKSAASSNNVEEEKDAMELDEEGGGEYHCFYCDFQEEEQANLIEHVVNSHPGKDLKFKTRIPGGQAFSIFAWR